MIKDCGHNPPVPHLCRKCELKIIPEGRKYVQEWAQKKIPTEFFSVDKRIGLECIYLGEVVDRKSCNCPNKFVRKCEKFGKTTLADKSFTRNCFDCTSYDSGRPV